MRTKFLRTKYLTGSHIQMKYLGLLMLSMVVPSLMEARKEGESGRRRITQMTRYCTVGLALFQSFGAAVALQNGGMTLAKGPLEWLIPATITMTTGIPSFCTLAV